MKLCSLASGSRGNAAYLTHEDRHFLIDAGISKKAIETQLEQLESSADKINAILITHEHIDHIRGLGAFLRKYPVPVYLTAGTWEAVRKSSCLGCVDEGLFTVIESGKDFEIAGICIRAIATDHDAAEPVAYRFSTAEGALAVITDLGTYDEHTIQAFRGIRGGIIEANHDIRMLEMGPYPYALKLRILGKNGHLSNEACAGLIHALDAGGLSQVILGHLSMENNLPDIAYETVKQELQAEGDALPEIHVAGQYAHSAWISI